MLNPDQDPGRVNRPLCFHTSPLSDEMKALHEISPYLHISQQALQNHLRAIRKHELHARYRDKLFATILNKWGETFADSRDEVKEFYNWFLATLQKEREEDSAGPGPQYSKLITAAKDLEWDTTELFDGTYNSFDEIWQFARRDGEWNRKEVYNSATKDLVELDAIFDNMPEDAGAREEFEFVIDYGRNIYELKQEGEGGRPRDFDMIIADWLSGEMRFVGNGRVRVRDELFLGSRD